MKQYFVTFLVVAVAGTLAAGTEAADTLLVAGTLDAANAWRTLSESPSKLASCFIPKLSIASRFDPRGRVF
jgi:hypothetical protein